MMENFKIGDRDFTKRIQYFNKCRDELVDSICDAAVTVEDMWNVLNMFLYNGIIGDVADWGSEICNDLPPCVIDYLKDRGGSDTDYLPELIEIIADDLTTLAGKPWDESECEKYRSALTEDIFNFVKQYKIIGIRT